MKQTAITDTTKCPKCGAYLCQDLLNPDKPPSYCWNCDINYPSAELLAEANRGQQTEVIHQ